MLNTESSAVTTPTFHGFIDSTYDALVLFEACQRGICPKVTRRLQEKERHLITSGSIFVFVSVPFPVQSSRRSCYCDRHPFAVDH